MALKSAAMAGLDVPQKTLERAGRWLDRVGGGKHDGLYGYQTDNPSRAMVAEGLFSSQLLGRPPSEAAWNEQAAYLLERLPERDKPNVYYWYYATLAVFQQGGKPWDRWNRAMREALIPTQETSGARKGSWEPRGQWSKESGRVVQTALAALTLEVYYRYLPLYSKKAVATAPPARP
jgi:hypothetical protein